MSRIPKIDNPQDFAAFSTEAWQEQDAFYGFWIERWRRTADFVRSVHWKILQEVGQDIKSLKQVPTWKRFPVINITQAIYADYLTQWLQSKVRFSALPDRPDSESIGQAELADQVLRSLWDKLEMETKRVELGTWLLSTGNACFRVFWDTNTGDMVPLAVPDPNNPGNLIPVNPDTLQPDPSMGEPILVDMGEIGVETISPQLVRWSMNKAQGVMLGTLVSFDDAVNRFGEETANTLK